MIRRCSLLLIYRNQNFAFSSLRKRNRFYVNKYENVVFKQLMNLRGLRICLRDIKMSETNKKTACLRSAVIQEQITDRKNGLIESVNFPPVTSIVRPYNGLSQ